MSSSRLKPLVTPSTALAIRVRARPWNLPRPGSGRAGVATSSAPFISNRMPGGIRCVSVPLGPLTSTASGDTLTFTPDGTGIGFLPIRDIAESSPDVAQHFAADTGLDGVAAGHHAVRGRENARAEPAHDARDVVSAEVDAPARPADPLETGNDRLAARSVLEREPQDRRRRLGGVCHLEAADVAFALENLRDFNLEPRRRNLHARMARVHRVPDSREHVCDRVSHKSAFLRPCGPGAPRLSGPAYQLLLMTPATSPRSASSRKHNRQRANFRRYARGRPHLR